MQTLHYHSSIFKTFPCHCFVLSKPIVKNIVLSDKTLYAKFTLGLSNARTRKKEGLERGRI